MIRRNSLRQQGGNPHRDREVSLAGAGGTHPEDQVVAFDGFKIPPLVHRLGGEQLLAEATLSAAVDHGAEAYLRVFGNHAQIAVQVTVVKDMALADEFHVFLQNVFHARNFLGFPFDFEQVIDKLRVYLEAGLDQPDVFIAGPKKAFNAATDLHGGFHLGRSEYLHVG